MTRRRTYDELLVDLETARTARSRYAPLSADWAECCDHIAGLLIEIGAAEERERDPS